MQQMVIELMERKVGPYLPHILTITTFIESQQEERLRRGERSERDAFLLDAAEFRDSAFLPDYLLYRIRETRFFQRAFAAQKADARIPREKKLDWCETVVDFRSFHSPRASASSRASAAARLQTLTDITVTRRHSDDVSLMLLTLLTEGFLPSLCCEADREMDCPLFCRASSASDRDDPRDDSASNCNSSTLPLPSFRLLVRSWPQEWFRSDPTHLCPARSWPPEASPDAAV